MTTICWDGKTLAGDTLAVREGGLKSRLPTKIFRIRMPEGIALFGGSGPSSAVMAIQEWLEGGADEMKKPVIADDTVACLFVLQGRCFCLEGRLIPIPVEDEYQAVGSGADYARCAMYLGKTAAEAVAIAAIFDAYTGGKITELTAE